MIISKKNFFTYFLPILAVAVGFWANRAEAGALDTAQRDQVLNLVNEAALAGAELGSLEGSPNPFEPISAKGDRLRELEKRDSDWDSWFRKAYPSCANNGTSYLSESRDECVREKYGERLNDREYWRQREGGSSGRNNRDRVDRGSRRGDNDRDRYGKNKRPRSRDRYNNNRGSRNRHDRYDNDRRPNHRRGQLDRNRGPKNRHDRYDNDRRSNHRRPNLTKDRRPKNRRNYRDDDRRPNKRRNSRDDDRHYRR
ncbi:MAG: hypothetical protein LBR11_09010 [Deltaproteobacteria bacterium]|nr:hypothetical protein [Deltaproteobacteria bacterium]